MMLVAVMVTSAGLTGGLVLVLGNVWRPVVDPRGLRTLLSALAPEGGLPGWVGRAVATAVPDHWRRGLARRLVSAGEDRPSQLDAALGLRVLSVSTAALFGLVGMAAQGILSTVLVCSLGLAVAAAPEVRLRQRTVRRAQQMRHDLPRQLDLLAISVEAGLGFDQALARVVGAIPGDLADEFIRMQTEIGAGMPRSDTMRAMVARCPIDEMRSFTLAMTQADRLGVPVGRVLRTQADEVRVRHRQAAQMQAQKAPVKLLFPMVLCIFPALLVVLAGPALLSIRSLFAG